MRRRLATIQDTYEAGKLIATTLQPTHIVTLSGDLGAGKTTLTKGILSYFGIDPETVTSPTFSIMNVYIPTQHNDAIKQIVHIDTYRLNTVAELFEIGFEDYVQDPATVLIIEWPERMETLLTQYPNTVHAYSLTHTDDGRVLSKYS